MTVDQGDVARLVAEAGNHVASGNTEAAVAALSAAGSHNSSFMPLWFLTALAAWQLGDTAKALELARACHELDPMNGTVAEVVASLYAQAGDMVESLYYGKLATALKADAAMTAWLPRGFPAFDQAFLSIQAKPLLTQARVLISKGRLGEALDKARQHVAVASGDAEGRLFYGELLLRGGHAGMAVETMRPLFEQESLPPPAASLVARALAAVGEAALARQWHDHACAAAPEDALVAAARIADAPVIADSRGHGVAWAKDWVARFVRPGKPPQWRPPGSTLVIGYLVSSFADAKDAAAVAAVARAHSRPGTRVIGYGAGDQSWDENARLRGAFDKWRDITAFDPPTLAKTLAVDGIDVIIDVGGFAAPTGLRALARVNTAVRVAWVCDAVALEASVYDAAIAPRAGRRSAEMMLWQPRRGAYPLLRDWTRRCERSHAENCRFGADAGLSQIDEPTAQLWRSVLEAAPGSVLLLRANDMAPGASIKRLIERFGADVCARIDVVDAAAPEDFYRDIDVALAPATGPSPRAAGEALACGVPVLALDGEAGSPYAAMLHDLGLGVFAARTPAAYVALGAQLAASPDERAKASAAVVAIADHGEAVAADIAMAIETSARAMLGAAAA